jgi:hypothetical protein
VNNQKIRKQVLEKGIVDSQIVLGKWTEMINPFAKFLVNGL